MPAANSRAHATRTQGFGCLFGVTFPGIKWRLRSAGRRSLSPHWVSIIARNGTYTMDVLLVNRD